MDEYIDREEVISIINTAGFWEEEDREVAITCVKYAEAADVAPVKHGKWEQRDYFDEDDNVYVCSACDEPWTLNAGNPKENNMKYCPNCGAKMDL